MTAHLARLFARDRSVVVVAMGRGGPPEPELVETPPTVEELVARSEAGRHAASDHLEIAALAGVPTIGCRRAGGGLAGGVVVSNVADGARLAADLRPDLVLFDGSGAADPAGRDRAARAGHRARRAGPVPRHLSPAHLRPRRRASVASTPSDRAARRSRRGVHRGRDRRLAPRRRRRARLGEPVEPRTAARRSRRCGHVSRRGEGGRDRCRRDARARTRHPRRARRQRRGRRRRRGAAWRWRRSKVA